MGNSSSQVEQERRDISTALVSQAGQHDEDENVDAASDAGSNWTSGTNTTSASRALARDLETSVMQSSQDYHTGRPPNKRRKRKSAQSQVTVADEVRDTSGNKAAVPPTRAIPSPPDSDEGGGYNEDTDLILHGNAGGTESTRKDHASARKHLARDLRRLKKTVLVHSGKAKWAPKTNGAKWEVEKLPPSQWLDRELTKVEQQTLARYKEKVKDAKRRLDDFDRGVDYTAADIEVGDVEPMSKDEIASAGHQGTPEVAHEQAIKAQGAGQDPYGEARDGAESSLCKKERKKQKKLPRKSGKNAQAEARSETEEPINMPAPELRPESSAKTQGKRKRLEQQTLTSSPPQQMGGDGAPPLRSVAVKHKTDLVKIWLNSQDLPEAMDNAAENDDDQNTGPRKRKRMSKYQQDGDEEYQAASQDDGDAYQADNQGDFQSADSDNELPTFKPAIKLAEEKGSTSNSKKSKQLKQRAQSRADPRQQLLAKSAGPFSAEEKSVADTIFNQVLQDEGIDEATLKHRICSWRTAGTFKTEIEEALPARDKTSIRKFCQRRYHMLERGAWTAEQDDDLRNAQANHPDQWKKHQDIVGRTAADCKDRWTLHLQHNKVTGAWNQGEEAALATAVERAIDTIKNDKTTDPALAADRDALENAISWKLIAKDLNNKRNLKQCREKWEKLKLRAAREPIKPAGESADEPCKMAATKSKAKAVHRALRKFEIGDFYDVFVEIHTSFDDPSVRFHDEEMLTWSIVAMKNPASRFNWVHYGKSLHRAALNHALKEWKIDSKKVRRRLEKSETLPLKAKVLAKLLEKSYSGRLHAMSRTFMPEMVGQSKEAVLQSRAERKRCWAEKAKGNKRAKAEARSKEFVEDSEEDEKEKSEKEEEGQGKQEGQEQEEQEKAEEADDFPVTPAIDDDGEEEESDDSRGEEEQSVCQRRLDAQINGREAIFEDEAVSGVVLRSIEAMPRERKPRLASSGPGMEDEESLAQRGGVGK